MKSIFILAMIILLGSVTFAQTSMPQDTVKQAAEGTSGDETPSQALVATPEFAEVTGTQKYKITCTSGTDVREITVITQEDNSTGVVYKKFDTVKTMALAKTDPAYADQVAEKIKGNLEAAGFTCVKE